MSTTLTPPPSIYPDWLRDRLYPHFDSEFKSKAAKDQVLEWVQNPEWIAKRAFQPFIRKEQLTWKKKRVPKEGQPKPGEAKKVTKKKRKRRPICFASHLDAHIYSYYASLLKEPYETAIKSHGINDNVIAYRAASPGYSNIQYARDVFAYIRDNAPCVALLFDIEKFFDTLNHKLLKKHLLEVLDPSGVSKKLDADCYAIFKSLTKFSYVKENRLKKRFPDFYAKPFQERSGRRICTPKQFREIKEHHLCTNDKDYGIPQGSSLSAVLSNIYMLQFDKEMKKLCDKEEALYRRYSDDIMVVCSVERWQEIEAAVLELISDQHLTSHPDKTEKLLFDYRGPEGLSCIDIKTGNPHRVQYLGFTYDGSQVAVRMGSVGRFVGKLYRSAVGSALECKVVPKEPYIRRRLLEGYSLKSRKKSNFTTYLKRAKGIMREANLEVAPIKSLQNKNLSIIDKASRKARKKAIWHAYKYPPLEFYSSADFGGWGD